LRLAPLYVTTPGDDPPQIKVLNLLSTKNKP
jgi:hypothetical protein